MDAKSAGLDPGASSTPLSARAPRPGTRRHRPEDRTPELEDADFSPRFACCTPRAAGESSPKLKPIIHPSPRLEPLKSGATDEELQAQLSPRSSDPPFVRFGRRAVLVESPRRVSTPISPPSPLSKRPTTHKMRPVDESGKDDEEGRMECSRIIRMVAEYCDGEGSCGAAGANAQKGGGSTSPTGGNTPRAARLGRAESGRFDIANFSPRGGSSSPDGRVSTPHSCGASTGGACGAAAASGFGGVMAGVGASSPPPAFTKGLSGDALSRLLDNFEAPGLPKLKPVESVSLAPLTPLDKLRRVRATTWLKWRCPCRCPCHSTYHSPCRCSASRGSTASRGYKEEAQPRHSHAPFTYPPRFPPPPALCRWCSRI